MVKNLPANARDTRFLDWEIPWRRAAPPVFLAVGIPTLVFLPGKSHGQRSLAGYSPWAHKESDTTKFLRTQAAAATAAKSLQSCPTLCDPIDSSPPGSPVPGILQTRTLEWVAISFSNA